MRRTKGEENPSGSGLELPTNGGEYYDRKADTHAIPGARRQAGALLAASRRTGRLRRLPQAGEASAPARGQAPRLARNLLRRALSLLRSERRTQCHGVNACARRAWPGAVGSVGRGRIRCTCLARVACSVTPVARDAQQAPECRPLVQQAPILRLREQVSWEIPACSKQDVFAARENEGMAEPNVAIPHDLCRRCGLRAAQPHFTPADCINALRDLVGELELRLTALRGERLRGRRKTRTVQ